VLVTKDTNLRIKADAVGLIAQDYTTDKVDMADLYPGFCERWLGAELMDRVKAGDGLPADVIPEQPVPVAPLQANEGVTLVDLAQPAHTLLARFNGRTGTLQPLQKSAKAKMGRIQPRNREQSFALDLLLDPAVALVTLVGKAGTGKTLLALAAGLHQVADEHLYERLLVTRPVISLGKEMGFLPGDLEEKMAPWMQPPGGGTARPAATGVTSRAWACWKWRRSATSGAVRSPASSWWWTRPRTSLPMR
jgi:PhoH-like ATPase